jgi:hypothetical protein
MKNIRPFSYAALLALVSLCFMLAATPAEKPFTGSVEFEITADGPMAAMMQGTQYKSYLLHIGQNRTMVSMRGSSMLADMDMLVWGDKGLMYAIKPKEKRALELQADKASKEDNREFKREDKTQVIQGYTCRLYTTVSELQGMKLPQKFWVAEDLKPAVGKGAAAAQGDLFNSKLPGMPLMVETNLEMMQTRLVIKAKKIDTTAPAASLFELPKGVKIEKDKDLQQFIMN